MPFNAEHFCIDHSIDSTTHGKHSRPGWVQIHCPFCTGHSGWHGGFNIEGGYYNCYRCGHHWLDKVISTLLDIPFHQTKRIIAKYGIGSTIRKKKIRFSRRRNRVKLPQGLEHIRSEQRMYLFDRKFRPVAKIIREWNLQSTGYVGNYKHRIFAPVTLEGQMVSFQCRASHPNQSPPYLACAEKDEIVHHKHILYGFDQAVSKNKCIVVEGITDVWRLGKGAVATFGKKYTKEQIQMLANNFNEIFIFSDSDTSHDKDDPESLEESLALLGIQTETIWLEKEDPGSLTNKQAQKLMGDLGF